MGATRKRAGLYARISEHDQKVDKVANQFADDRKHCELRGYEVVAEFPDDGVSATNGKVREEWKRMLEWVADGKLDVLVAVDEDRFSRSPKDTHDLQMICAAAGVTWDTVRGGPVDPAMAQGEAFSMIRAVMSRLEIRQKIDRQKAANRHRRMAGHPLTGTRPFGFETDRITHRADEAKEVAWAYATVISTGKLYPVLKDWNARGVMTSMGNKWSYATLQQLLRRASNAGLVEHNGEVVEDVQAIWEPIVTRENWETVCAILSDPNRRITKSREPRHLLAGIVFCGTCGSVMRSSGGTNKPGEKIYRCATKISAQGDGRRHASVRIADLDPLVCKAVIDSYFIAAPQALHTHDDDIAKIGALHARIAEVRQGIEDLLGSIGQPGYTKARVDRAVHNLSREETQLAEQIEQRTRQSAHGAMLADTFTSMSGHRINIADAAKHKVALAERFDSLSLEQKRTLVRSLVRVTVYGGRKLQDRVHIEHLGAPALDDAASGERSHAAKG